MTSKHNFGVFCDYFDQSTEDLIHKSNYIPAAADVSSPSTVSAYRLSHFATAGFSIGSNYKADDVLLIVNGFVERGEFGAPEPIVEIDSRLCRRPSSKETIAAQTADEGTWPPPKKPPKVLRYPDEALTLKKPSHSPSMKV
ncbi:uncharacterized protein FSUBG_6150 [Fusarium subglutinans]|uniref:Uncharacterized protein n=1 Tax=Gibberella subglutinans TaxID=42677 RepID=A0A8H5V0I2_GIBSU|nr:uncharacterized protein FSUBG_6150 [Fusarium subglutinans]KAF5606317.1 hypothetical protein FSUBG_6150 [Fusarium subglutinans]